MRIKLKGEKMCDTDNKKNKTKSTINKKSIIVIICLYVVIGVVLPFVFKYTIFENSEISLLSNNEWAGFLGSYVGGVLGGLGTLVAMWYTVRTTLEIQRENKNDTDKMREDDLANADKRDREEFANSVASHLGVYISHISKYHYAGLKAERLEKEVIDARKNLEEISRKIKEADRNSSLTATFSTTVAQTHQLSRGAMEEERIEAERIYKEVLQKQQDNLEWGNRLKANEEYFIMKALLSDICEAHTFLDKLSKLHHNAGFPHEEEQCGKWLDDQTKEILEEYAAFRKKHVTKQDGRN